MITNKQLGVKATFPVYMTGLSPILIGDPWVRHKFIFNLYDVDGDQIIGSRDLVIIQENIPPTSVLGSEIQMLADH